MVTLALCLPLVGPAAVANAAEPADAATGTSSGSAEPVSLLDPAHYEDLTARQQDAVDELVERYGENVVDGVRPPDAAVGVGPVAAPTLAGWFAQELFSWGFGVGLDAGFGALTGQLGLGGHTSAMDQLNASLAELNATVDKIQDELRQVADTVVWNAFSEAHTETKGEANEIAEAARDIANFEVLGIEPRASDVARIAEASNDALVDLGPTLLTTAGTGTIPALVALETHIEPVSDGTDQWDRLLTSVGRYRAMFAQGVMNLVWATQYDEAHDSNWGVAARSRAEMATERIELIYDHVGAPYPQRPDEDPFVHVNGADWALVDTDRTPYLDESKEMLTETEPAQGRLQALSDRYRSSEVPLRQYLEDRNVSPIVYYADSYAYDRDCGWTCTYKLHRWIGEITGNEYSAHKGYYWEFTSNRHRSDVEREIINPNFEKNRAHIRENPRLAQVTGITINPTTGMPALMGDEAIRAVRDGLENLVIERGDGDTVGVGFDDSGYDAIQVVRAGTDEVLASHHLASVPGSLGPFAAPEGAVEIRLGHAIDGDLDLIDARATSTIAANPGRGQVDLVVTVR